jgi:hypothetical protein
VAAAVVAVHDEAALGEDVFVEARARYLHHWFWDFPK